jgi:hypothetical protein
MVAAQSYHTLITHHLIRDIKAFCAPGVAGRRRPLAPRLEVRLYGVQVPPKQIAEPKSGEPAERLHNVLASELSNRAAAFIALLIHPSSQNRCANSGTVRMANSATCVPV